jgi:hypothetical protein
VSRLISCLAAALALAGCVDTSVPLAPSSANVDRARGTDVEYGGANRVTAAALWNQRTRSIIGRRGGTSNDAARTFALVSVAQYNAVVAAEDAKEHGMHPSVAGASAAASAAVLAALYPAEQDSADAQLAADAAFFPTLPSERDADFAAGTEVGRAVAASVLAYAASDGSTDTWTGTVPTGPGYWILTAPKPSQPLWGQIHPWIMTSGDQFRSPAPPEFGSSAFLAGLAEVRFYSDTRTADQLRIAKFWASEYGPGGPAGFFGDLAQDLAAREHLDERKAARTFAVMHMAIMDASIGCYDAKYTYWSIRPYQADGAITTPVGRPNFPSYPSAHSCLSAAAARVLVAYFPSAADELSAMVEEAGLSRIYGGLHFRFDITAGQTLGYAVADLALALAPRGHETIPLD